MQSEFDPQQQETYCINIYQTLQPQTSTLHVSKNRAKDKNKECAQEVKERQSTRNGKLSDKQHYRRL